MSHVRPIKHTVPSTGAFSFSHPCKLIHPHITASFYHTNTCPSQPSPTLKKKKEKSPPLYPEKLSPCRTSRRMRLACKKRCSAVTSPPTNTEWNVKSSLMPSVSLFHQQGSVRRAQCYRCSFCLCLFHAYMHSHHTFTTHINSCITIYLIVINVNWHLGLFILFR